MFIIDHLSAPCSYAVVIVTIIYTEKGLRTSLHTVLYCYIIYYSKCLSDALARQCMQVKILTMFGECNANTLCVSIIICSSIVGIFQDLAKHFA